MEGDWRWLRARQARGGGDKAPRGGFVFARVGPQRQERFRREWSVLRSRQPPTHFSPHHPHPFYLSILSPSMASDKATSPEPAAEAAAPVVSKNKRFRKDKRPSLPSSTLLPSN